MARQLVWPKESLTAPLGAGVLIPKFAPATSECGSELRNLEGH
jgi:hypothetical protein